MTTMTTMTTVTTRTLLKHEWLRTRGLLATLVGVIALVGIMGSFLGASGWPLLAPLGMSLGILAAAVTIPAVQLALAADYWRSSYGRTGYFTHSIPVRGSRIFWTKLWWAMIASLAAIVLTAVLALVAWWAYAQNAALTSPSWSVLADAWATASAAAPGWMIAAGLVVALAWALVWPVFFYFAVSIGHERRLSPLGAGGPVVVFVLVYAALQLLSLLGMVAIPFGIGMGDEQILSLTSFNLANEFASGSGSSDVMPIGFILAMVVLAAFCLWRTARSWNRKVALG